MEISGMSISGSAKPVSVQRARSRGAPPRAQRTGSGSGSSFARRSSGQGGGASVFAAAGRSAVGRNTKGPSRGGSYGSSRQPRSASSRGMRSHSSRGSRARAAPVAASSGPPPVAAGASRYKLAPGAAQQIQRQQEMQMQRDMARSARQSTGPEVDSETKTAPRKPTGVKRAKVWSPPVENAFRMQEMGWRDVEEYKVVYGAPELWENGLYKMLRSKQSGFFTYWSESRECLDKYLHRVKVFSYD